MRHRALVAAPLLITLMLMVCCGGGTASPPAPSAAAPAAEDARATPDGLAPPVSTSSASPDASLPPPDASCVVDESANAPPGVHFRFTSAKCTYSLKEISAGVDFGYEIVVDRDISLTHTTCEGAPDAGKMALVANVSDGATLHSYCGGGLCPGVTTTFVLKAGTYPASYHWDGASYSAPADACTRGPNFPAGQDDLDVVEQYSFSDAGGPYAIHGRMHLTITP